MRAFLMRGGLSAGLAVAAVILTTPARSDCYDNVGCTDSDYFDRYDLEELSCENLWHVRNRIYDEHGYCFATERGREAFDNSDCWVEEQADVELSEIEIYNVDRIVEVEDEKDCE
jgi:hypothetical protein